MKKERGGFFVVPVFIITILLLANLVVHGGIAAANNSPTLTGGTRALLSGTTAALVPWVDDPDLWDTFAFQAVSQPANGSAGITDNKLTYTPADGFTGTDSFTYQATDASGAAITGTAAVRAYSSGNLATCKTDSTVITSGDNSGKIQSRTRSNPCTFYSVSNTRVSDAGTPVTMDYFVNWPSSGAAPKAAVVLIDGGDLNQGLTGNTTTGVPNDFSGSGFLIRSAQIFADAGYLTIAINKPSDQPPAGSTDTRAATDQYRLSVKHAVDILTILKHVNAEKLDVFIAGSSLGSVSAFSLNLIAAGISVSSPATTTLSGNNAYMYVGKPDVPRLQPTFVKRPVHVLWHANDLCLASAPVNSQALYDSLAAITPAAFSIASGGVRVTVAGNNVTPDVCRSFDYHQYLGIENSAAGYITAWLDAQITALGGNKRPEAACATITTMGAPVQIDLSTLTRDQSGNTLSYALSHSNSSLGGEVTLAGSVATYSPPANASGKTDYFVYVINNGHGGISAAVIKVLNSVTSVTPASWDFGSAGAGTASQPKTFTITNNGSVDLVITAASVGDNFSLEAGSCGTLPNNLAPSAGCTLTVTFTPGTPGAFSSNLIITSNNPVLPNTAIPLSGTGVVATFPLTLTFTGTGNGTVSGTSTGAPASVSFPSNGSTSITAGAVVTLIPTAGANASFVAWSGCDTINGNQCAVTLNGAKNVTATFNQSIVKGDVNGDGKPDVFDALMTLQYAVNLIPHNQENDANYLATADIFPLDPVTGKPQGDGKIDVFDALLILQRAVNLVSW